MKRGALYFWPGLGLLSIRFRNGGGAALRFRPSPAAVIMGLHKASQRQKKAPSTR